MKILFSSLFLNYPVLLQTETAVVSSSIFNVASGLQIQQGFLQGSWYEIAKAIQSPHPRLKIADPPPPSDKCITILNIFPNE